MELNFYKQSATPNRINKSGYLSEVGTVNGVIIKETENSLTPDFIMMTSDIVLNSNYFFCSATSRYYFITSHDFLSGGRIVLHSRVDVLMTFRNEILSSTAWVEVSKDTTDIDEYDMLHNDLPFRQDYKFKGRNEQNSLFSTSSVYSGKSIVLIMK
jgi:hypothetical protein